MEEPAKPVPKTQQPGARGECAETNTKPKENQQTFILTHPCVLGPTNDAPVTHSRATVKLFALHNVKSIKVAVTYLEDNLLPGR